MHALTRLLTKEQWLTQQLPALGLATVLAEIFYKFHSFTLECLAFLATWYVLEALAHYLFGQQAATATSAPLKH